jgi:hypothetical protein
MVLTSYYLSTLSQHFPKMCENMCNNQAHTYKSLFRLQASGRDSVAKVTVDKQSIGFRLNKLNYLLKRSPYLKISWLGVPLHNLM